MPILIEHIDAIARKKCRDVLMLDFPQETSSDPSDSCPILNWYDVPARQQVITWLDQNQITWCPCEGIASEDMMDSYNGGIYIDVPFDVTDPIFQKLSAYLETPEGDMKIDGVAFGYLPLNVAMENAHHDEPGFWDRWAENF